MMRTHRMVGMALGAALLALLLAGCGGGGGSGSALPNAGTASLSGMVYQPAAVGPAELVAAAAGPGAGGEPAANCPVEALRERDRTQLRTGVTDARGQYRFEGLASGESVLVRARLRSGVQLMAQIRLRAGECEADVDEDTTLAAVCRRLANGGEPPLTQEDLALADEAAQACTRFQARNRYRYGGREGRGPNFADEAAVEAAAGELLAAAADNALALARQTRAQADCEQAAIMLQARLNQLNRERLRVDGETRARIELALRLGTEIAPERIAATLTRMLGQEVTPEQARRALNYAHGLVGGESAGEAPDICDAVACVCLGDGTGDQLRLRTREQLRTCVSDLLAGSGA